MIKQKIEDIDFVIFDVETTGLLANRLRKHGKTISLIDCYLAVLAKENKAAILTLDKHFEVIGNYI